MKYRNVNEMNITIGNAKEKKKNVRGKGMN